MPKIPWAKMWSNILGRSASEHHAALSKRLRQAKEIEEAAARELRRLGGRYGESRAHIRATRRLNRLKRRTNKLAFLVAAARPLVMRAH